MKRKICFRADAGATIGYGHFIRTLALADMLKDDFDCVFFTTEPSQYQIDELDKVCRFVILHEEGKFEKFLGCLDGTEIVVLDNYFFTTDYQRQIKAKGCKLVCIDDLCQKHYVADAVVCYGLVEPNEIDVESYTRLCLGLDWVLLRRPFLAPLKDMKREKQIIICLGGADPLGITEKLVSMLVKMDIQYKIVAILGDKVYLSDDNKEKVKVLKNLTAKEMAQLFESSSFGLFSASTVSIEAISRGLPSIVGYYADNQKEGYYRFVKNGFYIPLDYLPIIDENKLNDVIGKLQSFFVPTAPFESVPLNYKKLFGTL